MRAAGATRTRQASSDTGGKVVRPELGLDRHIAGGMRVGAWASISMYRDGVLEQIYRCGDPFINPDGENDLYNIRQPTDDVATYLGPCPISWKPAATRPRTAALLYLPGIRHCDRTKPAHCPSGRVPTDDVNSMRFAWLSHYKVALTGLNPQDDCLPSSYTSAPQPLARGQAPGFQ